MHDFRSSRCWILPRNFLLLETLVRIVISCNSDNKIYGDAQDTLQIIRFAISYEISNDNDGQQQKDHLKWREVEILGMLAVRCKDSMFLSVVQRTTNHFLLHTPAHDDNQGRIQESSLQRRAKNVGKSKIHLRYVSIVYSRVHILYEAKTSNTRNSGQLILTWLSHASSTAVRCSANFSACREFIA